MKVMLPEFDGRIISVPIAFKEEAARLTVARRPEDWSLAMPRCISIACRASMSPIWSAPAASPASPCVWRASGVYRTPRRRSP